jgi:hypothetical protein
MKANENEPLNWPRQYAELKMDNQLLRNDLESVRLELSEVVSLLKSRRETTPVTKSQVVIHRKVKLEDYDKPLTWAQVVSNYKDQLPGRSHAVAPPIKPEVECIDVSDCDSVVSMPMIEKIKEDHPNDVQARYKKKKAIREARQLVKKKDHVVDVNKVPLVHTDFMTLYVNRLSGTATRGIRKIFTDTGFDMKLIRDLNWISNGAIEMVVHQDYYDQAQAMIKRYFSWNIVPDFNPLTTRDPDAPKDMKDRAYHNAAKHYARNIFRRKNIYKDKLLSKFYNDLVQSKGDDFAKNVDMYLKHIECNPSAFFKEIRDIVAKDQEYHANTTSNDVTLVEDDINEPILDLEEGIIDLTDEMEQQVAENDNMDTDCDIIVKSPYETRAFNPGCSSEL